MSTTKFSVKCNKMRVNVIYTKILAKPLSRTRSAGQQGQRELGRSDRRKRCRGKYSSEHLIPPNQQQPPFLRGGTAEVWPRDLIHLLFVSVLVGTVAPATAGKKLSQVRGWRCIFLAMQGFICITRVA